MMEVDAGDSFPGMGKHMDFVALPGEFRADGHGVLFEAAFGRKKMPACQPDFHLKCSQTILIMQILVENDSCYQRKGGYVQRKIKKIFCICPKNKFIRGDAEKILFLLIFPHSPKIGNEFSGILTTQVEPGFAAAGMSQVEVNA